MVFIGVCLWMNEWIYLGNFIGKIFKVYHHVHHCQGFSEDMVKPCHGNGPAHDEASLRSPLFLGPQQPKMLRILLAHSWYTQVYRFKRIQRLSWIELIEVVVGLPSIKLEQYRCGLSAAWAHPASSFHSSHRSGSHLMVLGEFTRVWNVGTQKYGHVLNEASIFLGGV